MQYKATARSILTAAVDGVSFLVSKLSNLVYSPLRSTMPLPPPARTDSPGTELSSVGTEDAGSNEELGASAGIGTGRSAGTREVLEDDVERAVTSDGVTDKSQPDEFTGEKFATLTPSQHVRIQLLELMRKRFIITTRDKKGFFFQIIFPVFQIALVLAILTIRINPAGKVLKMTLGSYPMKAEIAIAGSRVRRSPWLGASALRDQCANTAVLYNTSSQVSTELVLS